MENYYTPSALLLPLAALSLASCGNQTKEETRQPNIIFMMTDDHTTQAMSCYGGNLIQTPNMDRIANEGIRFDNCYAVNALSGPSRACILTGKFSHENGFTDNASTFNGDQQTFPKLLQQAGYQTAIIGKWHLISEPQGFDHWSILSGQHEQGDYYDPDFWENGKHIVEKGYATDIITDKAIEFLEGRDKNKPFCMMYHQKAPHRNWMPAPRHLGIFNNTTFPEPWKVTLVDTGLNTMTGGRVKRIQPYIGNEPFMLTYGDGVSNVDLNELVAFHKSHGKIATITTVNLGQSKGVLNIAEDNTVLSFREKDDNDGALINGGFMVMNPEIFDYLEGDSTIFEQGPMQKLAAEGQMKSFYHGGFWQCMDTQREMKKLEELWQSGKAPWKIWKD